MACDCTKKICIEVNRVFDACLRQITDIETTILINQTTPATPATPLTYVSGRTYSVDAVLENLTVDVVSANPRQGRVQANVILPMQINFTDSNGEAGYGTGSIVVPIDTLLTLPSPSILPYEVKAVVSAVSTIGAYTGTTVIGDETFYAFNITYCASIILKVIVRVDVVIPYYRYAVIPPCVSYSNAECNGFFDLPLFPDAPTT